MWAAIGAGLERLGVVTEDGGRAVFVDVAVHAQRVRVERVTAFGEPWLLATAAVIEEPSAVLRDALVFNARLAVGSLAIEQGWLVLRAAMPETTDAATLERVVDFLAYESRRMWRLHERAPGTLDWLAE